MATRQQLFQRLDSVLGTKVDVPGGEPPRLVRANSAFSKRQVRGDVVIEVEGKSHKLAGDTKVV